MIPAVLLGDYDEVDDADLPVQRLLASFARYADAAYADASEAAGAEPAPLVGDVVLRGALTAAMTIERPYGTQQLIFHGGDVKLGSTDVSVASDGEQEVIGLARSLLDERWSRHELGVLTYSERNMDKPSVRASWHAVTAALAGPAVRLGTLRTLLVVVRVPRVYYDIHLAGEPSAHFVLDGDRLVARSTETRVRVQATKLARHDGAVVFHLGAGFSSSSNLPLGDELRDDALRRRYDVGSEATIRSLAIRLYREGQREQALTPAEQAAGEEPFADALTLEQVVRLESTLYSGVPETLQDFAARHDRAIPGHAVRALARVAGYRPGLVLVTVNFDELIELEAGDRVRRFARDDDIEAFPAYLQRYLAGDETAVPLLKLHGTISEQGSCVVNADQTAGGLPANKRAALRAVAELPASRVPWVYIGASLRDVDIVPALDDDLFRENTEESWVTPLRGASIDDFAQRCRARTWRSSDRPDLDERTISAHADDFVEQFAGQVEALNTS